MRIFVVPHYYIIFAANNCSFLHYNIMTFTQSLSGVYFSSNVPDVKMSTSGVRVLVAITVDSEQIYREHLYPVGGEVALRDLTTLFTPYARRKLLIDVGITVQDLDASDSVLSTATSECQVAYCTAELLSGNEHINAEDFFKEHFLTLLAGSKFTAAGRLEYLHYLSTDEPKCTAMYQNGTGKSFQLTTVTTNGRFKCIDCSPNLFLSDSGSMPIFYDIEAGGRSFRFYVEPQGNPSPALLFVNSFGVEEMLYCRGIHKVSPSYNRNSAYIEGKLKNYNIVETRKFEADTGYLSTEMAAWADDLFRSDEVRLVTFHNGSPVVGKEVVITDSKSEVSNEDDNMSKFTFAYQYAQKNHNIVEYAKEGRIFDHTFDNTFN